HLAMMTARLGALAAAALVAGRFRSAIGALCPWRLPGDRLGCGAIGLARAASAAPVAITSSGRNRSRLAARLFLGGQPV
ncbi:hypothetical protein ABTD83_21720, partial [Acinetobacter baumannii]